MVTEIVKKYGSDKIMINNAADGVVSDPLDVLLTAREMRINIYKKEDIEKVTFTNAFDYYKQSPRFSWKL